MIPKFLSDLWTAAAPAMGNHLWQSTVFAAVAGLLTLVMRKNHASARYWLWMAASIKFLLPFSLLVTLGNHISPRQALARSTGDFYLVMDTVSQPFSRGAAPVATHTSVMAELTHMLPAMLAAIWLCGFLAVLFTWLARWRRISSAMRAAIPAKEGRELETLRRLEQVGGIRRQIRLLLSRGSLEPGIFGVARPVLIWPEGISDRLEDSHLEAILAHEVWHVRRRDNLAAVIHMLVEAIFWFHPLVWWLGARLIDERERACDEQVLQLGNHPKVYAESILKICEFCVGSPLACVAGVTGADLKQRIVNIMNPRITHRLDLTRKVLLTAAAAIALFIPLVIGLMKPAQSHAQTTAEPGALTPGFESVSIKPGVSIQPGNTKTVIATRLLYLNQEITATNVTLQDLIAAAYGVEKEQVSGAADWSKSELFSIEAKIDAATFDAFRKAGPGQGKGERQREFQTLLADRFHLVVHRESRALPGYSLVIATNGPKLQPAKPGDTYADGLGGIPGLDKGPAGPHRIMMSYGELIGQALPISTLAQNLSFHFHQPVVDNTGLTGDFDFKVQWTPAPDEFKGHKIAEGAPVPDPSGPSLTVAIEQQLGLRLDPQTVRREVVVIDRAEKPQFN